MNSFRRVFGFCLIASGLLHPAHAEFSDPDFIVVQSLLRMQDAATLVRSNDVVRRAVNRYLDDKRGQRELLDVVAKLELRDQTHRLAEFFNEAADVSLQVEATRLLLASGQEDYLRERLSAGDRTSVSIAKALGMTNDRRSVRILAPYVTADVPASLRIAAADGLGRSSRGQESLVSLYQSGKLPLECHYVVYNSLLNSKVAHAKEVVVHLAPPPTTGGEALPPMRKLVRMRGDGKRGKATFHGKGTCAKCHKVHGEGKDIGPDLSEIGSKLSREAMFTAILNPNAGISHNYEQYGIVTADGLVLNGLLVNQTEAEVTLKTAEGVDRTIPADDIEEMVRRDVSLMPENLHQLMTVQELVDMVDYLILLTKKTQSGAHVDRPNADQSQQTSSH
ncbi:MAG: c-type cytochrome, partial [Rhodopirellula sp. JB053]